MRLRSKGLGRKELVMDFREYEIVREGEECVVVGVIRDPVNWDFTIRVSEDDVAGMARLILNPKTLKMVLTSFFKRKKKHHWSESIEEHLEEGKKRLVVAKEEAPEKARSAMAPQAGPKRRPRRVIGHKEEEPVAEEVDVDLAIAAEA
jgi:hypothetical protein